MTPGKTLALAALSILAIGGGLAIAQQTGPGPGGPPAEIGREKGGPGWMLGRRQPPSPEMIQRMLDGRIAGAKAALRLTPDQEKLWPSVEAAVRDVAAKHVADRETMRGRMKEMREQGKRPDMLEMLERGSQRSASRSTELKRMADALRPLHATLSDEQKQVLAHSLRPGGIGGGRGGWHHRG